MVRERIEDRGRGHREQLDGSIGTGDELETLQPVVVAAECQQVHECPTGPFARDHVDPHDIGDGDQRRVVPQQPDEQLGGMVERPRQHRIGTTRCLEHGSGPHGAHLGPRPRPQQRQTDLTSCSVTSTEEGPQLRHLVEPHRSAQLTHGANCGPWAVPDH
jgi:hypothetical protein